MAKNRLMSVQVNDALDELPRLKSAMQVIRSQMLDQRESRLCYAVIERAVLDLVDGRTPLSVRHEALNFLNDKYNWWAGISGLNPKWMRQVIARGLDVSLNDDRLSVPKALFLTRPTMDAGAWHKAH